MDMTAQGSLNALVLIHPYFSLLEVDGIVDNGSTFRLGHVELDKYYAGYRAFAMGFSSTLDDTSLFRIMHFDVPVVERTGYAIIFCATKKNGKTEEFFAGWVNKDKKADASKWISKMNSHISRMIK